MQHDWLTIKEAALECRCSVQTIRRRVAEGTLKSFQQMRGGKVLVSAIGIEKMMENTQRDARHGKIL